MIDLYNKSINNQMYQDKKDSPSKKNDRQTENDNQTDSSYVESQPQEQQYVPPTKDQITEALYKRYHVQDGDITEEAEEQAQQTKEQIKESPPPKKSEQIEYSDEEEGGFVFKIKNLDTGEQEQIRNEQDEQRFANKIISKLSIQKATSKKKSSSWKTFWLNVQKNNQNLMTYCETGMYDEVQKIITVGENSYPCEINCKGLDDWRAVHFASYEGHDDIIALLIKHGADLNVFNKFHRNPLHVATMRGSLEAVKVLCDNKIDVDAFDNDGNTALHFACQNGYKQIIKYLVSINCKILKNKDGNTPIDDCIDPALKKIFVQYGFKEKGQYQYFDKSNPKGLQVANKPKKMLIVNKGVSITPDDFVYYRLLGKGSFGEVFLVRKKNEKPENEKYLAMKVLSKDKILGKNLKRYALTQRNVMSIINHPFMVRLHYAFQTASKLFLVMDYYPGGDLGKLIARKKSVPEEEARKYIAQLILAFEALHKNMIVFRDLKPDNVVLDSEGHCRLTDFGLSKEGVYNNITQSFCGSVAYLAPEILSKQGHSRTVDWYLVGLLLYELIVGLPPYYNSKKQILFENIKRGPLKIPKNMSGEAKDLIKKLLCRDPKKRLGYNRDSQQLKEHPFFEGVDWAQVFNRKLEMPPVDIPKINPLETIKVAFNNNEENSKKIEGWTFVSKF